MDDDVRRSLREGDLRGALLLARTGRLADALDLLEAAWLGGNDQGRELFFEVLRSQPDHARLDHAARLDRLACRGIEAAGRVWREWFPAAGRIVGTSESIQKVRAFVYAHARSDAAVVFLGESGVGHAHVARVLHELSGRAGFLEVNAAAVTLNLFEEEIRGVGEGHTLYISYLSEPEHEDAAFAVARERRAQLVVGALPGEPFRWSRGVERYAAMIEVPPLRERRDDLALLARCLLDRHEGAGFAVAPELVERLAQYDWPGNVRELENNLWRLAHLARAENRSTLPLEYLPPFNR